jgi:hypothetical protein
MRPDCNSQHDGWYILQHGCEFGGTFTKVYAPLVLRNVKEFQHRGNQISLRLDDAADFSVSRTKGRY